MLFAKQDIDQLNLKVRAGRALPERFQGFLQRKDLRASLGDEVIVDIDSRTEGYVLVQAGTIEALKAIIAELRDENAKLQKRE